MKVNLGTSGQDGSIGRYTLPPCTTKKRTITNLKPKNNQNCKKIKLYGSPTTKEIKKKHSSRLVGGAGWGGEGQLGQRGYSKVVAGGQGSATFTS